MCMVLMTKSRIRTYTLQCVNGLTLLKCNVKLQQHITHTTKIQNVVVRYLSNHFFIFSFSDKISDVPRWIGIAHQSKSIIPSFEISRSEFILIGMIPPLLFVASVVNLYPRCGSLRIACGFFYS